MAPIEIALGFDGSIIALLVCGEQAGILDGDSVLIRLLATSRAIIVMPRNRMLTLLAELI